VGDEFQHKCNILFIGMVLFFEIVLDEGDVFFLVLIDLKHFLEGFFLYGYLVLQLKEYVLHQQMRSYEL